MSPPSLRRVAAAAGVSPSTASRALNGNVQVPEAVRDLVRVTAARMGYRKNALISSVMRDFRSARGNVHRGTLGFLTCDPPSEWKHGRRAAFVQPLLGAVQARAAAQGYGVETFLIDHPEAMPFRRLAQVLVSRGISGVLLSTASTLRQEIAFPWERFATVAMGSFYFRPRLHRVGRDFYRDVHAAVEKLWSFGYKRVGFATFEKEASRQDYMGIAAFNQIVAQIPLARRIKPYCAEEPSPATFVRWVKRNRVDAVMCEFGSGLEWLRDAGYDIPGQIGYVCLNLASPLDSRTSGLFIPYAEIGSAAVDLLTKLIEQREIGVPAQSRAVQVCSEWNEGATLAVRPAG